MKRIRTSGLYGTVRRIEMFVGLRRSKPRERLALELTMNHSVCDGVDFVPPLICFGLSNWVESFGEIISEDEKGPNPVNGTLCGRESARCGSRPIHIGTARHQAFHGERPSSFSRLDAALQRRQKGS
jgi:hypothetical protein